MFTARLTRELHRVCFWRVPRHTPSHLVVLPRNFLSSPLAPTESVYHTGIPRYRKSTIVSYLVFMVSLFLCIETGARGVRTVVVFCPWLSLPPPTANMSGHYARTGPGAGGDWSKPVLLQAHDDNKDQTYFLSAVSSSALRRVRPWSTRPMYLPSHSSVEFEESQRRGGLIPYAPNDLASPCGIRKREARMSIGRDSSIINAVGWRHSLILSQGTHGLILRPLDIHECGVPPVLLSKLGFSASSIMWRTFGGDVRPLRSAYPRRGRREYPISA